MKWTKRNGSRWAKIKANRFRYAIILPGALFFLIYRYIPMGGLVMAFQKYNPIKGISGSEWVGLDNFRMMFEYGDFSRAIVNTIVISFSKMAASYFCTVSFALLLNEIQTTWFKKTVQTISYAPNFLSWVTVYGIASILFSPQNGLITNLTTNLGLPMIDLFTDPSTFRFTLVFTALWKGVGWGTIIYIAGLAGVDPTLYEAAIVDGAGRFKRMIHISLPALMPLLVIQMILSIGNIMNENLDQLLMFQNPIVYEVSDVFETIVYRQGMENMQYGYASAVGFFQSTCAVILTLTANWIAKRMGQEGIW